MAEVDIVGVINSALVLAGLIGVPALVTGLVLAKKKLKALRNLVVSIDDAWEDDKISEAEFEQIVKNAKALVA